MYRKTWGYELVGSVVRAGSYFDGGVICRFQREMKGVQLQLAICRVSGAAVSAAARGR